MTYHTVWHYGGWYDIIQDGIWSQQRRNRRCSSSWGARKGARRDSSPASNLAVQRAQHGYDVVLLDTDIQGAAAYWARVRQEAGLTPEVPCRHTHGTSLQADLQALTTQA